jgi:asparagine N-glycosylation enzyme membrane subunit Stt3
MSNIDGRRAGGSRPPFTAAVIILVLIVSALFVWRSIAGADADPPATIAGKP